MSRPLPCTRRSRRGSRRGTLLQPPAQAPPVQAAEPEDDRALGAHAPRVPHRSPCQLSPHPGEHVSCLHLTRHTFPASRRPPRPLRATMPLPRTADCRLPTAPTSHDLRPVHRQVTTGQPSTPAPPTPLPASVPLSAADPRHLESLRLPVRSPQPVPRPLPEECLLSWREVCPPLSHGESPFDPPCMSPPPLVRPQSFQVLPPASRIRPISLPCRKHAGE